MRRRFAVLLACSVVLAACGDGIDEGANEGRDNRGTIDGVTLNTADTLAPSDTRETTPDTTEPEDTSPDTTEGNGDDPFQWNDYGDGTEDGMLAVPLDYSKPNGETIQLYVARHKAVDQANRIGTLLVNPGGPGSGGTGFAFAAENIYGQPLLDRFDIVGWDPRGTGSSEPVIDCIDYYNDTFAIDSSPDTPSEVQALTATVESFVADCEDRSAELLPHVNTMNSARDMDAIREALGEGTISYFGFSYGSELGATWATMFPSTVRAAVLDGAVDPTVPYFEQNLQQAAGFEAALTKFLAECSANPDCAFHNDGNAEQAFDELAARLDSNSYFGFSQITHGTFFTAVLGAMYDEARWPSLEAALADAQDHGDWTGVEDLYNSYYGIDDGFGYSNDIEAYFAIACLDDPGTTSIDELFGRDAELAAAAPRVGRTWLLELAICAVWPVRPTESITITGEGAGPVLVVGTTGDAATPLDSTRNMAKALEDGHLVIVDADQHTGYGVNSCVNDAVDNYLVDPSEPLEDELVC